MCHRASESYCSYVFFFCVMQGVCCCNFYLKVVCLAVFSWAKGFFVFHVVKAKLIACLRFLGCHERCVLFFVVIFILKLFVCLCFLGRKVFFCILCGVCVFLGVMKGVCCLSQIRRWCFVRAMSPRGFPTFHIHRRIHTLI